MPKLESSNDCGGGDSPIFFFEKPAWLQILPSSSVLVLFYISSGREWLLMCFWSFKIWVHVFLFVIYTKCSTHLFVISCPAVVGEADTARGVHDFTSLINIAIAIILAFWAFRGPLNASSATRGYLLNKKGRN
jgi:hypothetical protein